MALIVQVGGKTLLLAIILQAYLGIWQAQICLLCINVKNINRKIQID